MEVSGIFEVTLCRKMIQIKRVHLFIFYNFYVFHKRPNLWDLPCTIYAAVRLSNGRLLNHVGIRTKILDITKILEQEVLTAVHCNIRPLRLS